MSQISRNRYEYKAVWTALAETEQGARAQVIGDVDETYLLAAAEETRSWLEETIAIQRDDVILEIGCGLVVWGRFSRHAVNTGLAVMFRRICWGLRASD